MSASENETVLQVSNLTKIYGREVQLGSRKVGRRIVAVNDVSFSVKKGEIFGFLGPNGAGKTTTIRSILGYLTIKTGTIEINGLDHRKDGLEIRKNIGYLPDDVALYNNFTGEELIKYFGAFRPVDPTFIKNLRSIFKVNLTLKIRSLSSGNRQQVAIIAALASNPDLLILDEPSSGLDPLMAARFHNLLRDMSSQGKTIFLSSHNLAEVQAICNRVGIIKDGRIVVIESVKDLQRKSIQIMKVDFAGSKIPEMNVIKAIPNVISVEKRGGTLQIKIKADVSELLKFVTSQSIERFTLEDSSLEEIFLEYYKNDPDRRRED